MKKLKLSIIFLTVLFLFVTSFQTFAQVYPYVVWNKTYNAPSNLQDSSVAICMNSSGMVFVAGWSLGTFMADIVAIRYNPATGDTIWAKRFIGQGEDISTAMTCDNNAVYVTGWTFSPGPDRDVITIKFNAATGDTMWVKKYDGPRGGGDYGRAITSDANFVYVTGRVSDVGTIEHQRFMVLKYDINTGAMASGFPFIYTGDTLSNEAHAIKVDNSGNIYITGQASFNNSTPPYLPFCNILTLKINSSGTLVWAKYHNASGNGVDNGVTLGFDNTQSNLFVAGWGQRVAYNDFEIIRYNPATGDSTGYASYNGPTNGTDFLVGMVIDAANNIYITGNSQNNSLSRIEIATLKYNSSLVQQWVKRTINNDGHVYTNWIANGNNNDIYIEGFKFKAGQGYNMYTVRYNATTGDTLWTVMENGTANANDFGAGVVTGDSQNVFVTGSAIFSPASTASIRTLRYASELIGIKPISTEIPVSFTVHQNYPNPFNPETSIRFDIPAPSSVNLIVYDVSGRVVEVIASNLNLLAGKYEAIWNADNYASGIYFYRIQAGSFTDTKKMILVK